MRTGADVDTLEGSGSSCVCCTLDVAYSSGVLGNWCPDPIIFGITHATLDFDVPGTTVNLTRVVFTTETVIVTSSGGGAVLDDPEVAAPRKQTVERGVVLRTRRVVAGELLDLDTVDQGETMEVAANASSVAISRLVTNVTVTGDVQCLFVDETGDNPARTTDFAVVTGCASGVDISVAGSNVSVVVSTLNGSLATATPVSVAVETRNASSTVSVETVVAVTGLFAGLSVDAQPDNSRNVSPTSLDVSADLDGDGVLDVVTVNATVHTG